MSNVSQQINLSGTACFFYIEKFNVLFTYPELLATLHR